MIITVILSVHWLRLSLYTTPNYYFFFIVDYVNVKLYLVLLYNPGHVPCYIAVLKNDIGTCAMNMQNHTQSSVPINGLIVIHHTKSCVSIKWLSVTTIYLLLY